MKVKSRKQARKEFRKAKKLKKHEFFSKKKTKIIQENSHLQKKLDKTKTKGKIFSNDQQMEKASEKVQKTVRKDRNRKEFKNPLEKQEFEIGKERRLKEKLEKEIQEQRIKQLKADNLKEDIEIQKLEKHLKINKGNLKAFASDGLDYLLDICDKTTSRNTFEKALDSDTEFDSDLKNIVGVPEKKVSFKGKKTVQEKERIKNKISYVGDETLDSEESDLGEEEIEEDKGFFDFELQNNSESDESPKENLKVKNKINKKRNSDKQDVLRTKKKKVTSEENCERDFSEDENNSRDDNKLYTPKIWEDIYGRSRDEKGNVVNTYTPPLLRKKKDEENFNEKLARLKKQLKGLLNRLAESNMAFISNQIEQLYMSNSRNDMNETLCNLFSDSLVTEVLTPERLIAEHAVLVAVLHANIGSEIGAHILQYAVTEFCKMLKSNFEIEDKRINNILMFILHLYNFQIFHSKLMYDIINELLKNLEEKQIELLLTTLRTVGFNLRKDNPIALKSLVLKVQDRANSVSANENSSRVKFMLEMLMAIKNNNMSKIPNYNPELVEKLRKNLKVLIRKGNYNMELNISLQDLLNAEKHGRWWIVGSAWSGSVPFQPNSNNPKFETVPSTEFSQKLLELAKKQRMNTDVRKNIFCILMSAEDFLEAFEKLLKLNLKGSVEREIMNVAVHCALQEKNFNPYYVFLANKFCAFDRKYQMMLQCTIWDRIKELKNALPVQVTNLAKFVGNIILEKGLPISILKVIQFSELDKPTLKFMRQVLFTILLYEDRNAVVAVFKRIADSSKLKLFRESLRLFLQHFVLKNIAKNVEKEKVSGLAEMINVAEQALTSSDSTMIF